MAVDPANPKDTLVLGRSLDDDPIAWSSDGSKLLLRSHEEDNISLPLPGLFVLHPDGSRTELVREIPLSGGEYEDVFPGSRVTWGSFSPDGTEVAYGAQRSPGPFIIDANGSVPRPLGDRCDVLVNGLVVDTCGEGEDAAAWSPDGSRILWLDFIEGGGRTKPYPEDCTRVCRHRTVLSSINPDGTGSELGVARLPGDGASSLVWSPDGSRLAFEADYQIFVINTDGSGLQQVTRDGDNRWPAWSPDGSRIAFVHDGTLYTIAPDGTDMQSVEGVTPYGAIAWNPVG
jgi:Tol biopolymer transport system component